MKKHIIFGGFDYAVRWEMNQDAVYRGIDYFVDNDPELIGTTYLGKPIYSPEKLLEEDRDHILILIGSVIYHTEIEFQLKDMGFQEDVHYKWAIGFCGDEACPRLWKHTEWNDRIQNENGLKATERGENELNRLRIVSRLIDFTKINTVVDICAANERIRAFLPEDIRYIPVDYIRYSEETILCDLTKNEFPEIGNGGIPNIYVFYWLDQSNMHRNGDGCYIKYQRVVIASFVLIMTSRESIESIAGCGLITITLFLTIRLFSKCKVWDFK